MKQTDTYLVGKEVQVLLKISRATLARLVKNNKLKVKKLGRMNRYKMSDVEKMMK